MSKKLVMLTLLVGLGLIALPAFGAQLCVQQSGTSCNGGEPNVISNPSSFTVFTASGSFVGMNPVLIIVAEYNGIGTPTVSFGANPSVPLATVGTYGLTTNEFVNFNAGTGGTAFSNLGLSAGGSESFGNLSGQDTKEGFAAPTSYTLFVFAVPSTVSNPGITIDATGQAGSLILAYDCDTGGTDTAGCGGNGNILETVNTNNGILKPPSVPEPGTLGLLGLGLLGASALLRRKSKA
jgi:hypothetical protein